MMFKGIGIFYLLFFTISIVLAIFPFLDNAFTSIFYRGNNQFVVQHYLVSIFHFYEFIIRDLFMPLIVVVILFLPIVLKFSNFLKNRLNMFDLKIDEIIYVWMSALSVVIVVNSLKTFWGRARPVDTFIFDGDKIFTSWIAYSNECLSNCSFVSGDASVGFFIACLYYLNKNIKILYISILFGLIIGFVRIGAGAHFLSDILMSFVVVNLVLTMVYGMFSKWIFKKT